MGQIPQVSLSEVKPGMYSLQNFKKEDRSYMSNFDRMMGGSIPVDFDIRKSSIEQLIKVFHKPSILGLNIELQDDSNMGESFVCSYMPTLSSLYFKTKNCMVGIDKTRKPLVLEYHEDK